MFGQINMPEDGDDAAIVTVVAGLIDESGSMTSVRDETISGYNGFVAALKKELVGKEAYLSTFLFDLRGDGAGRQPMMRTVASGVTLADAAPLTRDHYCPLGITPLYDAIAMAVHEIDMTAAIKKATKVTFIIQTDGRENASRDYNHETVRTLIEARVEAGWQVIFLGADLKDAAVMGQSLGVSAQNSMRYSKVETQSTFDAMATGTKAYRSADKASADVTLTEAEKRKLGDLP